MAVTATNNDLCAVYNSKTTLSCSTNHNWKICIWSFKGRTCIFEYVFDESAILNQWTYDEVSCDPKFVGHEIIKPKADDKGNNNTICSIEIKQVTFEREYTCTFLRCNLEENNMCKTKVSKDCPKYSATINVKVDPFNLTNGYFYIRVTFLGHS